MKVLLLAPEFHNTKAWVTAHFCDEIARQHETVEATTCDMRFGYCGLAEYKEPAASTDFDVIVVNRLQFARDVSWLGSIKNVPKVCIVEDYFPRHYDIKNQWLTQHDFDLVFFSQNYFLPVAREFRAKGDIPKHTRFAWLPFSVDTDIYTGDPYGERRIDVSFICSLHQTEEGYPNRRAVAAHLEKLKEDRPDLNILIRLLENKGGFLDPGGGIYCEEYARTLANSKIVVASLDATGSLNYRHLEAMASGALLLTDGPPKDWRKLILGYDDAAVYSKPSYLYRLIDWTLQNHPFRNQMAAMGQETVRRLHSNKTRVQQMFAKIQEVCFAS